MPQAWIGIVARCVDGTIQASIVSTIDWLSSPHVSLFEEFNHLCNIVPGFLVIIPFGCCYQGQVCFVNWLCCFLGTWRRENRLEEFFLLQVLEKKRCRIRPSKHSLLLSSSLDREAYIGIKNTGLISITRIHPRKHVLNSSTMYSWLTNTPYLAGFSNASVCIWIKASPPCVRANIVQGKLYQNLSTKPPH